MTKCKEVYGYLRGYKTRENPTHTCMGGGSWRVPDDKLDGLYEICDRTDGKFHIVERHIEECSPILIDLDFRQDSGERRVTDKMIEDLMSCISGYIRRYIEGDRRYNVLQKPSPYWSEKDKTWKDGIHIIYPEIVTDYNFQFLMRIELLAKVEEIFKDIRYTNPLEDVYDESVIKRNGLLMHRAVKTQPVSQQYEITYYYGEEEIENETSDMSLRKRKVKSKIKEDKVEELEDAYKTKLDKKREKKMREKKVKEVSVDEAITEDNLYNNLVFFYDTEILKKQLSEIEDSYYSNYSTWFKFTMAMKHEYNRTKNSKIKDIWKEVSKVGVYSGADHINNNERTWETNPRGITFFYIKCILDKYDKGTYKKRPVIYITQDVDTFTYKPDTEVNERYINLDNVKVDEYDVILVKSTTGTGKTHSSSKLIKRLIDERESKIVSITSKVTLSKRQLKAFKDANIEITHYQDTEDINSEINLVVQLDSLVRLDVEEYEDAIIYLDEFNSMLSYLVSSPTLNKRRISVFNKFILLLNNARLVLCTDADISDVCVKFIRNLIDKRVYIYKNTYKPLKIRTIRYKSKAKLINTIKERILNGMREGFVCLDSKKEQKRLVTLLRLFVEKNKIKVDFMIYNSESGNKDDTIDCHEKWKGKIVIISPVITYGIDWVTMNKIPVFFIGKCCSIPSNEMFQMINRVRNIEELHYYISETKIQLMNYSVESVKEDLEGLIKTYVNAESKREQTLKYEDLMGCDLMRDTFSIEQIQTKRNFRWSIKSNIYSDLYLENDYYNKVYRSNPSYHLDRILRSRGFEIEDDNEIDEIDKEEIKEAEEREKEEREDLISRIFNIEGLSGDELKVYENIMKRIKLAKLTKDDFLKYRSILEDERKFDKFLNFTKLLKTSDWFSKKQDSQVFLDFRENRVGSVLCQLENIKYILDCLDLSVLSINTEEDYKKFGTYVNVDSEKIIKSFRVISKNKEEMKKGNYRELYYFVINRISTIVGGDIYNKVQKRLINRTRIQCYVLNKDITDKYMSLYKNIDRFFENVDDKIREFHEAPEERLIYENLDFDE